VANDKGAREPNPLVERVDALLRRHEQANEREANDRPAVYGQGGADVPVLTETVDDVPPPVTFDSAALEALARELERAVLARLGPEVDRVIEERLARTLSEVLGQALDGVRSELTVSVTQMVREAIAASVAQALGRNPER
jgi:hypothetical protein